MIIFKFQKGGLPTAPPAEKRFAKSKGYTNGDGIVDSNINFQNPTKVVYQDSPYLKYVPASISQVIGAPGDTIYTETPEVERFARFGLFRPIPVKRTASTLNPNGQEYDILKRRFNTAWNISKHQYGGPIKEVNDPTRGAKAINEGNQRKAKGLFKGMISGQIMPTIGNIGSMIGAAWNGWIDPQSSAQIGAPPVLPAMLESGTLMNYVTNPAEQAARADFMAEVGPGVNALKEGLRSIAGSGKIPRGTISEDWMYPKELIARIKGQPKKVFKAVTEEPKSVTTNKVYTNTSKKQDHFEGINSKTRSNFKSSLSMETKDNRHGYSGFTGPQRGRIQIAQQMIRKYPEWNKRWEKQQIKIEKATDPQRKKQLQKEMHALLKEFMNKMGY